MTTYEEATAATEEVRDMVAKALRMWPTTIGVDKRQGEWIITVGLPRPPAADIRRPEVFGDIPVTYKVVGSVRRLPRQGRRLIAREG
ncbi:MAG: hypothetical protein MRY64_06515 [Hyphomonadaceae bacterium]|nr:hypothetical protein [Hyphomonadaceae bacterium]